MSVLPLRQRAFHVKSGKETNLSSLARNEAAPAPAHSTVVIHLRREMDTELFHSIFGTVLKRIRAFCERYDTDADGRTLARAVECDFVKDTKDQEFFILVAVRGGKIVGYLLAHLDIYYATKLCYIHILELNRAARLDKDLMQLALALVNEWAKERGAIKVKAAAVTERHARRLEQEYRFKRELITLGRKVE